MASFLAVPVDPKKNLATKSAAAPRRFSSGKANSAKQQTTRKNVAKKKVGATTNLKRTSIGNKKKMNKNSEGRQQDSGVNTTNSQGKDKPNVVFNIDKPQDESITERCLVGASKCSVQSTHFKQRF